MGCCVSQGYRTRIVARFHLVLFFVMMAVVMMVMGTMIIIMIMVVIVIVVHLAVLHQDLAIAQELATLAIMCVIG